MKNLWLGMYLREHNGLVSAWFRLSEEETKTVHEKYSDMIDQGPYELNTFHQLYHELANSFIGNHGGLAGDLLTNLEFATEPCSGE